MPGLEVDPHIPINQILPDEVLLMFFQCFDVMNLQRLRRSVLGQFESTINNRKASQNCFVSQSLQKMALQFSKT